MRYLKSVNGLGSRAGTAIGRLLVLLLAGAPLASAQDEAPNIVVTNAIFVGEQKQGPCNQVRISFKNDSNYTIDTPFDIGISFDQRSPTGRRVPVDWGYKMTYDQPLPGNTARAVGFVDVELPVPEGVPIVANATAGLPFATSGQIWTWVDMPFDNDYGAIDESGNTWEWQSGTLDPHDTTDNVKVIQWNIEGYCSTLRLSDAFTSAGENAIFTLSMAPASKDTIVAGYVTKNGSAAGGSNCFVLGGDPPDFLHRKGTVTFEPGETQKSISIPTCVTPDVPSSKTFTIELGQPEFAEVADGNATGYILPLTKRLPLERRLEIPPKRD